MDNVIKLIYCAVIPQHCIAYKTASRVVVLDWDDGKRTFIPNH